MRQCDFEKLVQYLDKQLDLDGKLDLLEHLDQCDACRDALYQISRDRDAHFFQYRPYHFERILAR